MDLYITYNSDLHNVTSFRVVTNTTVKLKNITDGER